MGIKSKRLKKLEVELRSVLAGAAKELRESLQEPDTRYWGHEFGRTNGLYGYCAGIECRGVVFSVVVRDLHLFPRVDGRMLGPQGGCYPGSLQGKSLECLSELPDLLDLHRGYVESGQGEAFFGPVVGPPPPPPPPLEVEAASREQLQFVREVSAELLRAAGPGHWFIDALTNSDRESAEWATLAHPHLRKWLPGLELDTLSSHYQPESELELEGSGLPLFVSEESREELCWSEFYGAHPDASGLIKISRPGFDSRDGQALVRVRSEKWLKEGVGSSLLLFERRKGWELAGSYDLEKPLPRAIPEELERRRIAPSFETRENAARLGVDRVRLERVRLSLHCGSWVVFELGLEKGNSTVKVGVFSTYGLNSFSVLTGEPLGVIDYPLICVGVSKHNPEDIWEPLSRLVRELE